MPYRRFPPVSVVLSFVLPSSAVLAAPAKPVSPQLSAVTAAKVVPRLMTAAKTDAPAVSLPPPPAPVPAPVSIPVQAAAPTGDVYTGILIDARDLPGILRSPAPAIYGPGPEVPLLYPDRTHVPTPDEVQDESVVRYYHSENEAEAGVAGSHPLVLKATAVLGYAKDALQLSAADVTRLQDLEKTLHFTQTWKVGFLIPAGQ